MKVKSIKIISEFENYEEFLNCIKCGKTVIKKGADIMGMCFPDAYMKYDSEKDCFYYDFFEAGEKYHIECKFKTAKDFEKETDKSVAGLGHPHTLADDYPLSNFYMVELTQF